MSTSTESASSSAPILHFLNNSTGIKSPSGAKKSEEAAAHDDKTQPAVVPRATIEQTAVNDDSEKPIKVVSHNRRVHFPTEDSQLRIISYPPEPLSTRPLLSLGVILQRYRATCQRLQLRPINALLDQLGTMDDGRKSFQDRLDCLKIVNEKIDLKSIDAIEEILSRCRFHTLDFESSSIDDAALAQLFDVIEYYESCTHINLSNNRSISFQGYQSLAKYLKKSNCLERLDTNTTRFDENSMMSFTRALRFSSTLYELHIESCQLNGKLLQKFIQNIRTCNSLRELYLCDNRLQVQDSLLINDLIRSCGSFLFLLDLRSNSLQDTGMSHLASQLSQYDVNHSARHTLHKISLQANQVTQQGVGFLAKSLLHNRTVRSLNLSQNNLTNEGLFLLRDALLTNRTVNELVLRNCQLTDQAAIALAEFIAESTTIQYVDLRENNIQASGICGMAIAIKSNKSLLKLDFDPIVATPTNLSALTNNSNNNIDGTANTNSLLSISNLRKMTAGFGSFTNNIPVTSNVGGGGTRELLEQKARWMADIAATCQRNALLYEEKLRLQEQETAEETVENEPTTVTLEDIQLEEQAEETKTSENIPPSTTGPIDISNNIEEISELKDTDETEQSTDAFPSSDTNIEPITTTPLDGQDEIEQPGAESVEPILTDEQSESNDTNQNSTSPSSSDLIDDVLDDDKRKMHHSDSLYILRKKVKNETNDTSDDESPLSSSINHDQD